MDIQYVKLLRTNSLPSLEEAINDFLNDQERSLDPNWSVDIVIDPGRTTSAPYIACIRF